MAERSVHTADDQLNLRGRLAELSLVWPWIDSLAAEYALPSSVQFAIQLCLEEALSNVIRHGYGGESYRPLRIHFRAIPGKEISFAVEDGAPHFNPLETGDEKPASAPQTLEDLIPGGQGVSLMRRFAGALDYEPLVEGNRLTLTFPLAQNTMEA